MISNASERKQIGGQGPFIVVAAQLSGGAGGGGSQLAVTGGLVRSDGKRLGANVQMSDFVRQFAAF